MIVVLRDDDMGEQPCAGAAASNRMIGRRGRDDRIASPARQLLADMPDHLKAARNVIERLGDLLTHPPRRTAAGWADAGCAIDHVLPRQVLRQRAPCWFLCLDPALDRCSDDLRSGREPLGMAALQ